MAIDSHHHKDAHKEIPHKEIQHGKHEQSGDVHHNLIQHAYGRSSKSDHHAPAVKHSAGDKHTADDKHAREAHKEELKEARAEQRWEKRHEQFLKGALSCHGEWTNLIQHWVTHNEAAKRKFEAYTPNDAGHGISVGLLQFNQKKGSLPDLLQAWHKEDPAKFNHTFGKFSNALMNQNFVKAVDFVHTPILNNGIKSALADREFQQVQVDMRNKLMVSTCEVARENGFKSLLGRAVVADTANQMGLHKVEKVLHHVPHNRPEHQRIQMLIKITNVRPHGEERISALHDNVVRTWHKLGLAHRPENSITS